MTQKSIGHRIKEIRKSRRLTAQELVDHVGIEGLTRSVLANLESGRKDDLPLRQALALAAVLEVPVIALVVDPSDPWEEQRVGVPNALEGMAAVEFVRTNEERSRALYGPEERQLIASVETCAGEIAKHTLLVDRLAYSVQMDPDASESTTTQFGHRVWADYKLANPEGLRGIAQAAVLYYRRALLALVLMKMRGQSLPTSSAIAKRLEWCKRAVVDLLRNPEYEDVDYGQDAHRHEFYLFDLPPIDPATGELVRPSGEDFLDPSDKQVIGIESFAAASLARRHPRGA